MSSGDTAEVRQVQRLSDQLLAVCEGQPADIASIALLDAAVRIVKQRNPGWSTTQATQSLAFAIDDILTAECALEQETRTDG